MDLSASTRSSLPHCQVADKLLQSTYRCTTKQVTMTEDRLDRLEKLVLDSLSELKLEFSKLKSDVNSFDNKFETYQKATQSVVNLAFGLIASATIVTLASAIFRR
jgi:hypothetical protein